MADFGKSFSESFDKSMAVSQAGTYDLIKEKIKLDVAKAEEATRVSAMKQGMVDMRAKLPAGTDTTAVDAAIQAAGSSNVKEVVEPLYAATVKAYGPKDPEVVSNREEITALRADRNNMMKDRLTLMQNNEQDRLEKNLKADLNGPLEKGTGVIGIANRNVDLSIKLRTMFDDPAIIDKKGNINLPPSAHTEVAMGLAALLSPNNQGQVSERIIGELKQKTAREALASTAIMFGANPAEVGGSTQGVLNYFKHTIDRLGTTNENLRDTKINNLIKQGYSNLDSNSLKNITENLPVSSFKNYLSLQTPVSFNSEAEANSAGLKEGQNVKIGDKMFIWRNS